MSYTLTEIGEIRGSGDGVVARVDVHTANGVPIAVDPCIMLVLAGFVYPDWETEVIVTAALFPHEAERLLQMLHTALETIAYTKPD